MLKNWIPRTKSFRFSCGGPDTLSSTLSDTAVSVTLCVENSPVLGSLTIALNVVSLPMSSLNTPAKRSASLAFSTCL